MILLEKIVYDKMENSLLMVLNVLIERVMFSIEKYDIREILNVTKFQRNLTR